MEEKSEWCKFDGLLNAKCNAKELGIMVVVGYNFLAVPSERKDCKLQG